MTTYPPVDLPLQGGDTGSWGDKLNGALRTLESRINDVTVGTTTGLDETALVAKIDDVSSPTHQAIAGVVVAGQPATLPPTDGSVTDAKVAPNAGISLDKTVDSAGGISRLAMTAAERSKLSSVPADAQSAAQVSMSIAQVVGSAPPTLSTLGQLATAVGGDTAFATTMNNALAGKVPTTRTVNGKALSANVTLAKADVGLGSVDNTPDASKPVSTAQQAAIDTAAGGRLLTIYWDSTAGAWPTVPVHTVPLWLVSTHDTAATAPNDPGLIAGDVWKRRVAV